MKLKGRVLSLLLWPRLVLDSFDFGAYNRVRIMRQSDPHEQSQNKVQIMKQRVPTLKDNSSGMRTPWRRTPPCWPGKVGLRCLLVLSYALLGALFCSLTSCQSPSSARDASWANDPPQSVTNTFNRLQEGDEIQILFEGATNLNTMQKISADGLITMPFVGRVKAVGKTPLELEALLKVLFDPQVRTTDITVKIVSSAAVVYVVGAIVKPGRVPLDRPLTALDAIMEAGGFDHNRAKLTEVAVFRIENGKRVKYRFNLKRALKGEDSSLFYLKPFDIVYVPEKTFNF